MKKVSVSNGNLSNEQKKKDRKKVIRTIFQSILLLCGLTLVIRGLFFLPTYKHEDVPRTSGQFIAVSYFGVNLNGNSEEYISEKQLNEHLMMLRQNGYVSVTQQDIIDFYYQDKPLPEKALFLIFEDGRRDTAIFSEKILSKYNYTATIMTYADRLNSKDLNFLTPNDLKRLIKRTYWEMGSNGYRLSFINAKTRYGKYYPQMKAIEYYSISPYLDRRYNHYLMDFIRDEYGVPMETYSQMKKRIDYDYNAMSRVYEESLGFMPSVYVLMHSNTGQFGTNERVSDVNAKNIYNYFQMNFNREGYALNSDKNNAYDLTRVIPQNYWPTNHLLMKIRYDTGQEIKFFRGDETQAGEWELLSGAVQFTDNKIFLTTEPKGTGLLRLKRENPLNDYKIDVLMDGNKLGIQRLYLEAKEDLRAYTLLEINNNVFYIKEKSAGDDQTKTLMEKDLDQLNGVVFETIEQNKYSEEIAVLEAQLKISQDSKEITKLTARLEQMKKFPEVTADDGDELFKPAIEIKNQAHSKLVVSVTGDTLSVSINDKLLAENLVISRGGNGILLGSGWGGDGYSQRNITEHIYDGVFTGLKISDINDEKVVFFDSNYTGFDFVLYKAKQVWLNIIKWFIETL